jgi:hypothetical protein
MNKYLLLTGVLLLIVACSLPTPTAAPAFPASPVPQENTPTIVRAGTLWLQVLSPLDGVVVNTPQVDVIGLAPAGTVLSINDDILIVGADGQFKTTLSLEEGPNLIEFVASDEAGNQTSLILTVVYEP